MKTINDKIRLVDLAKALGITPDAIRKAAKRPSSPLRDGAEKIGTGVTGDTLLSIDSVLKFLVGLKTKARKVKFETICELEEQLRCLKKH